MTAVVFASTSAGRCGDNLVVQCLRLKPAAVACRTGCVGPVTAKQNPHMHFVGLALQPAEESPDAVPTVVVVFIVGVTGVLLAVNHKILIGLRQFLERQLDIDLLPGAGP